MDIQIYRIKNWTKQPDIQIRQEPNRTRPSDKKSYSNIGPKNRKKFGQKKIGQKLGQKYRTKFRTRNWTKGGQNIGQEIGQKHH